ncbi:MAG TPA: dCTP deaminase [Allosphingosinicella sp.]|jgi:dCTP deaminase
MSTLAYQDIKGLIDERNLVAPADPGCIGPASYELRIGSALMLGDRESKPIAIGQEFVMRPFSHLLIGTLEQVNMPDDLAADLSLKSKFGRSGFFPWYQGFVDPGYQGHLTLSVVNMSSHPVLLKGGMGMCHIIFRKLSGSTSKAYDGEYNRSRTATGPIGGGTLIFGAPLGDLASAGFNGIMSGVAQGLVSGGG